MATYVCLLDWTQKGIENVKDSPKRLEAAREVVKAAGGAILDFYMTIGKHDMVLVVEARDDTALAKALLKLGSQGAVRTTTMRAFSEAEYREIIGAL